STDSTRTLGRDPLYMHVVAPPSSTPSQLMAIAGFRVRSRTHALAPASPSSSALVRQTPKCEPRASSAAASTVATPDALSSETGARAPTVVAMTGIAPTIARTINADHTESSGPPPT